MKITTTFGCCWWCCPLECGLKICGYFLILLNLSLFIFGLTNLIIDPEGALEKLPVPRYAFAILQILIYFFSTVVYILLEVAIHMVSCLCLFIYYLNCFNMYLHNFKRNHLYLLPSLINNGIIIIYMIILLIYAFVDKRQAMIILRIMAAVG